MPDVRNDERLLVGRKEAMSYPVQLSQGWSALADKIDEELYRARKKFPTPDYLVTALTEEHGEAVRAVLEHMYLVNKREGMQAGDWVLLTAEAREAVRKELIQTAAMCVRLYMEGDPVHKLPGENDT